MSNNKNTVTEMSNNKNNLKTSNLKKSKSDCVVNKSSKSKKEPPQQRVLQERDEYILRNAHTATMFTSSSIK